MKKQTIIIITLILGLSLVLSACNATIDGLSGNITTNITKLTSPTVTRIENDIIYWSSVENASSYIIQIGDETHQSTTTSLSYPISSLFSNAFSGLYVKVRALPSSALLFSESDWSDNYGPISYDPASQHNSYNSDYVPENSTEVVDKDLIEQAIKYGIGFGYNFINDEYFNSTKISHNSILDIDKVLLYAQIREQPLKYFTQNTICESAIEDFASKLSTYYNQDSSLGAMYCGLSANISNKMRISSDYSFKDFSKALFVNSIARFEQKNYNLVQYGNSLSSCLNKDFSDLINNRGYYSSFSDSQIVNYIFSNYGTHLLLGVKTGGNCDYYYALSTNNTDIYNDFKTMINISGSAQFLDFLSASSSFETGIGFETSYQKNESKITKSFEVVGGSTKEINDNPENISGSILSGWASSFTDANSVTIGVSSYGAISLVDILEQCGLSELANKYQSFVEKNANEQYAKICKDFEVNTNVDEGDTLNYAGGHGTKSSPYLIATAKHLRNIHNDIINGVEDKYYQLTADIDVSSVEWMPLGYTGSEYKVFKGTLDGNYHSIIGLKRTSQMSFTKDNLMFFGLFGEINNSEIKNITFEDVNISFIAGSKDNSFLLVGAISGRAYDSTIRNCSAKGKISNKSGTDKENYEHVGGIVGEIKNATISHCANKVDIEASRIRVFAGGIVGVVIGDSTISNCYNIGNINISSKRWVGGWSASAGGIIGLVNSSVTASVNNCYNCCKIDCKGGYYRDVGGIIGTATNNSHNNMVTNNYYYTDTDFEKREIWNINKKGNSYPESQFTNGEQLGSLYNYSIDRFSLNENYCWLYKVGSYPTLYWEE